MNLLELESFDREHIWHPYAPMPNPLKPYSVASARGAEITLADGRVLIDGMSSWWAAVHGYNHPKLNAAAIEQLGKMSHVMFGGLTHEPAVELGKKLLSMVPRGLDKIFYCDSGSVAVEIALKMALQYWHARGEKGRTALATVKSGYHGDTWHAMSVCDPDTGMHSLYSGRLNFQHFAPAPRTRFDGEWDASDIAGLKKIFEESSGKIAALVLEPVVQGAGGMRFYSPQYLKAARKLCDEFGVLLIADEIASGFFRSGKMFACEWAGISPDIMCVGKAISGGYMSFAATLTTKDVAETISSNPPHAFMHGPTFMANPLACAISRASLDIIDTPETKENVARIEKHFKGALADAKNFNAVADVRVLGAIGVLEMKRPVDMLKIQDEFVKRGVWVRPFGKLVYSMPPYIISDSQLEKLTDALLGVAKGAQ